MERRDLDYADVVANLGRCTLETLESTLKSLSGTESDGVALAVAMLVASAPAGSHQPSWFESAFAVLGQNTSPLAFSFLKQAALNAENACTRLFAVRNLKAKKLDDETRKALHEYAKGSLPERLHAFQSRNPSPEDFQVAALQALSSCQAQRDSLEVVWEVCRELSHQSAREPAVYSAALDCLRRAGNHDLLPTIVAAAEAERGPAIRLDYLSTCAGVSAQLPEVEKGKLRRLLVEALRSANPDTINMREGLETLAGELHSPDFLKQLVELLGKREPNQPLGKLVAAVLDAYEAPDDVLCEVSLDLVANPANVEPPCIRALHRCAELYGERILTAIAAGDSRGMERLRTPTTFGAVFASPDEVWAVGLKALRAASTERAMKLGPMLTNLTLACAVPVKMEDWHERHRLEEFARTLVHQQALETPETRKACCQVFDRHALWPVVQRAISTAIAPDAPTQYAYLLTSLLAESDALGQRTAGMVLEEACRLGEQDPGYPSEGSSCGVIEDQLAQSHSDYLAKQAERLMLVDGHLLRYMHRLCRRAGLDFYKCSRRLLNGTLNAADTIAAIREVERARTKEGLKLICESTKYVSEDGGADPVRIRAAALESVGNLCDRSREGFVEPDDECIRAIHERIFHDALEVRLKAYDACSRVASFSSIQPLREREKSERDAVGLDMLRASLRSIRGRLRRERPPISSVDQTLSWLENIRALGDGDFLPEVTRYLCPPHSEPRILLAALGCLRAFGSSQGLGVCRQFLTVASPHGEVLSSARRTAAMIAGRHDLELLDSLPWLLGEDSGLCEPDEHNYEHLFGAPRCHTLAACLQDCRKTYDSSDWDTFVTMADSIGHVLAKQIYETRCSEMGLSQEAATEYASRSKPPALLNRTEFRDTYPEIKTRLQAIHELRQQARTAHAEDEEGKAKVGIRQKGTADNVKSFLEEAFSLTIAVLEAK